MAPTTSYIPRFLLPQYGTIWRSSTARAMPFARPISADVGQVLVRYASKTAAAKSKSTTTTTATAAEKVAAPKAASTKAAATKTTKAPAAKTPAAKAPAAKTTPPKTAPTKPAATTKATAAKAATPKTPTSASAIKNTPITPATKPAAPEPVAKAPPPAAAPKPATANPSKPIVLEKPEKFNPPSHGARLPRSVPKHYGGALGSEELMAQKTKEYPGLPPPPNTWSHWFINNKHIHMFITLGALVSLGVYTFTARFNANSPFADMIPPIGEFLKQPINYIRTCVEVLKLHEEHESAQTAEKRRRRIEDVQKRNEYRKAHGLPIANGIESWTGTGAAAQPAEEEGVIAAIPASAAPSAAADAIIATEQAEADGKRKKFFGIF
ncbi:hypothetical protein PG994_001312 [Apiospora phragmitis]|uniref:Uncharacterized protein n=1 Tax=Apiospora phragmitis TaxID=2905665 RepID=A0ABR1WT90_9PEZI